VAGFVIFDGVEGGEAQVHLEWLTRPYNIFAVAVWRLSARHQHGKVPDSLAIIAASPDGASYTRHYFDSRGVVRIYAMSFRDGIWTLVRDAPDFTPLQFAQRFTGRFTDNGSVIHGAWETAGDGERWEHDFDLTYTKLT
jgi:hypothetical protein